MKFTFCELNKIANQACHINSVIYVQKGKHLGFKNIYSDHSDTVDVSAIFASMGLVKTCQISMYAMMVNAIEGCCFVNIGSKLVPLVMF